MNHNCKGVAAVSARGDDSEKPPHRMSNARTSTISTSHPNDAHEGCRCEMKRLLFTVETPVAAPAAGAEAPTADVGTAPSF